MPYGKLGTMQDCEDLVYGCLFMGTGGGGRVETGMKVLQEALAAGLTLQWHDADSIDDAVRTATAYNMGSIAPMSEATREEIRRVGLEDAGGAHPMVRAVQELEQYVREPIGCIVPAELGAGNTPLPLVTGALLDIPVVDGDYAGRAIPDEMQTTPFLHGKDSWPFASVDRWGNVTLLKYAVSPQMLERIGKMLAVAAYDGTSIASTVLSGREMKDILVRGTLSRSLALGRAMREAKERGEDPVDAAVARLGGWRLFEGVVAGKDWEDRDGYMFGTTHIRGTGAYAGQQLDVWFKNENHVSWLDGEPWVCSPDLLTLVDRDQGVATTNTNLDAGDPVAAVGVPGRDAWRDERALNEASGPRYFGFDIDYVPIEVHPITLRNTRRTPSRATG